MPPQAPRPGVIPLRPLDVGEILGGAFRTMGRYWKQLFGIAAAVYGVALAVVAAVLALSYALVGDHLDRVIDPYGDRDPAWADVQPLIFAFVVIWVVAVLVMLVATAMIHAACPAILQEAVLGRRITFGTVWRRAWARVPAVIGTLFLIALIYLLPVALVATAFGALMIALFTLDDGPLVAIPLALLGILAIGPLAIWLWVKFSLAPAIVVFEGQRPIAAMRRSSELVRGDWWRIFGISLLGAVIAGMASYALQLPFNAAGTVPGLVDTSDLGAEPGVSQILVAMGGLLILAMVGQLIGQIFSATFPQLVIGLLYVDERIRKENLAPMLAEAAAVPPPMPLGAP